jgi:hypothetical protein
MGDSMAADVRLDQRQAAGPVAWDHGCRRSGAARTVQVRDAPVAPTTRGGPVHATVRTAPATSTSATEQPEQPVLRRRLADPAGRPVLEVGLWPDEQQARATDEQVWAVYAHLLGRSVGLEPTVAQVVRFDGPRDAAAVAASRRAGTERIWPAVRDLDGLVDTLVLERPDGAELVLSFATSVDHFARAGERIMGTQLLPGEDPALLTGPDRIEVLHVVPLTVGARA